MKHTVNRRTTPLLCLFAALALLPACRAAREERHLRWSAAEIVEKFEQIDSDGNGQLNKAELNAVR